VGARVILLVDIKSEIGSILLLSSILCYFFAVSVGLVVGRSYGFLRIASYFELYVVRSVPTIGLTIGGLAFYFAGRKQFLKRSNDHLTTTILLLLCGSLLVGFGFFFLLGGIGAAEYQVAKVGEYTGRTLTDELIVGSPILLTGFLWLMSGIVLLIDIRKSLMLETARANIIRN